MNNQVITLIDVRIVDALRLLSRRVAAAESAEDRRAFLLEKLIDQKVVIDLAREKALGRPGQSRAGAGGLAGRLGPDEAKRRLDDFGWTPPTFSAMSKKNS